LFANPFVDQDVATRYAEAHPRLHDHVVALLADRIPAPDRALDMGCGTGLSTKPLTSFARVVVGVDMSEEMLTARAGDGGARFVGARAERLPFRDDAFDLATAASAIRWFDLETLATSAAFSNRRPGSWCTTCGSARRWSEKKPLLSG
jgi:ubiquinone/menaquinone biosynthesis C-methylase UbiE